LIVGSRALPAALVALLFQAGCRLILDIPGDPSTVDGGGDGVDDGDGVDADGGPDGAPSVDAGADASVRCGDPSVFIGFDEPAELEAWTLDERRGCEIAIANGQLELRSTDPPGICRAFRDLPIDLVGDGLQIKLANQGHDQMSVVYSLILDDGAEDIRQRRRLRIERESGAIKLGECAKELCETSMYGTFPYDVDAHLWWRFDHDADSETLYWEFGTDQKVFSRPDGAIPVTDVSRDLLGCVGVELATYETSDTGTAAFDFLVSGNGI
jgi:hypothetical protein